MLNISSTRVWPTDKYFVINSNAPWLENLAKEYNETVETVNTGITKTVEPVNNGITKTVETVNTGMPEPYYKKASGNTVIQLPSERRL